MGIYSGGQRGSLGLGAFNSRGSLGLGSSLGAAFSHRGSLSSFGGGGLGGLHATLAMSGLQDDVLEGRKRDSIGNGSETSKRFKAGEEGDF